MLLECVLGTSDVSLCGSVGDALSVDVLVGAVGIGIFSVGAGTANAGTDNITDGGAMGGIITIVVAVARAVIGAIVVAGFVMLLLS